MQRHQLAIIIAIIINGFKSIQSEELLELNCLNETQCKQFQRAGVKSYCIQNHCQCETITGEKLQCKPTVYKLNNIIGGPCPCRLENAECDEEQQICYCVSNYMPSIDKRRCIKKTAILDEECEQDLQCQREDFNAVCNKELNKCLCLEGFNKDNGKCASVLGTGTTCQTHNVCMDMYGPFTDCNNSSQQCVCADGYFTSLNNTVCLKTSQYLEKCTEHIQCMGSMGRGGKCLNDICECDERYFVEQRKTNQYNEKTNVLISICTPFIKRGQYCRHSEDCYQRQLNESEQTMNCFYGECNCRNGFISFNDGDCIRGLATLISSWNYKVIILFAIVNCVLNL